MKSRKLLTLRMMARVGLVASLLLFTLSALRYISPYSWDCTLGPWTVIADVDFRGTGLAWWSPAGQADHDVELMMETNGLPKRLLPGLFVSFHNLQFVECRVSHWFLSLTFLIATVATSVSWKKPAVVAEQELPDE